MGFIDILTLSAYILGGVCLVAAVWLGRQRGARTAVMLTATGLLFGGLAATGLTRVVARVVTETSRFLSNLVFNPLVWAGVGALALAGVLYVVGGRMKPRAVRGKSEPSGEVEQRRSASAKGQASSKEQAKGAQQDADSEIEGMDDIDAILRKHGIE